MLWLILGVALAGPVPMFTGSVPPPIPVTGVRAPAVPPRAGVTVVPVIPRTDWAAVRGLQTTSRWFATTRDRHSSRPQPVVAPPLPRVPAEPVKTEIARAGKLTPISELPSAFVPIPAAENRLPVTVIRPRVSD